ncbi:hypothetical protein BJX63DRAFT_431121 [Aspergillus granulosus]|uniref:F-box domain-containing protein n=1 Tax=Aspergillus granulosus TaxID=176169 RepID=A0ABR4HJV0_9EURO
MPTRATARKRNLPDTTAANPKRRMREHYDPIQLLQEDTLNMIFSQFSPEELVSLQRVSRGWQAALRSWIEVWGLHCWFPFTWTHAQEGTSRDVLAIFKHNARQQYLMQHGRPVGIFHLKDVHSISSAGDYVVWSTERHDRIYWQCFERNKNGKPGGAVFFPVTQFCNQRVGCPPSIAGLSVNNDGVFLVNFATTQIWRNGGRDVVYSPVDGDVLWARNWRKSAVMEEMPMLVGKNSIYCVKKLDKGYTLSAYDFHGKLRYHSPEYHRKWDKSVVSSTDICWYYRNEFRVIQGRDDVELIISQTSRAAPETTIQIINAATGLEIYRLTYNEAWNCVVQADPFTDTFAITSIPNSQCWTQNTTPNSAILQKFSYRAGCTIQVVRLSTDVISFLERRNIDSSWIINPFTHAAFSYCKARGGGFAKGRGVIPTTDGKHLNEARATLELAFNSEPAPTLNQCFFLSDPVGIQLPKRPTKGRLDRVNFNLFNYGPGDFSIPSLQITDKGQVILRGDNSAFVFEF